MKNVWLIVLLMPSVGGAADPEKLTRLRDNYRAAVERATAPLKRSYFQELERLKAEYMRSSKLEDALAVDQEMEDPEGKNSTIRERTALIESLVADPWRGREGLKLP